MKTLRIVVGILMLIPLGLLVYHLLFVPLSYDPNSLSEMAFLVFGVPILTVNYWVWFEPEMVDNVLWGRKPQEI